MPVSSPAVRRHLLVASAVAGVVAAHGVAYVLAFPDGHARARELADTGHGYWHLAVVAGLWTAGVVAVNAVRRGVARGRPGATPANVGPLPAVCPKLSGLVAAQVVLFTMVEVAERVASGSPTSGLLHDPGFRIGLAVQLFVAAGVLLCGRLLEATASHLMAGRSDRRFRRAVASTVAPLLWFPPAGLWLRALGSRAPPIASS